MEGLKEAGKGVIAFANIISVLVFIRSFWQTGNYNDLIGGIVLWIGLYALGIGLINYATRRIKND